MACEDWIKIDFLIYPFKLLMDGGYNKQHGVHHMLLFKRLLAPYNLSPCRLFRLAVLCQEYFSHSGFPLFDLWLAHC